MKKITILAAALLGSVYFANAQVGIGTPTPNASAMLDITANNKGVLIPRIALTDASTPLAGADTHENSLLVYNTATASKGVEGDEVTPGFYYWFNGSWERVTSQTDLENIIGETNQELENIINLLQTAYPSNNLDGSTSSGADLGGGMVYTPATGTEGEAGYVPAIIEYVYYDGTTYVKQDMTSLLNDLIEIQEGNVIYNSTTQVFQYWDGDSYEDISLEDIVQGFETKTSVVTIEGQQFYLAENFEGTIPATIPNPLPTGMYLIDVVGGVVNNFEDILNSNVVIEGEQYTIEEYIEYISQNAMQSGVTKIVLDGSGQASFQTWNTTTEDWVDVEDEAFSNIIKTNESKTSIEKEISGTVANGDIAITYDYFNENQPDIEGAPQATIDMNADVLNLINNNSVIRQAITDVLNLGGNVYFGNHDEDADTPDVLYTIDVNGDKIAIEMSDIVVEATTINNNSSVEHINNVTKIKQNLGDKLTNTSVFTGDTVNINGTEYFVYKGVFTTSIQQNTAVSSGITLDKQYFKVLSMNLTYANGVSANVTDLKPGTEPGKLDFNIGVGQMYNVLSATADTSAEVIIEFASTVSPILVP